MSEICVPIPHFAGKDIAEVEVKIGDNKTQFNFRLESFPWQSDEDLDDARKNSAEEKILSLKSMIESYDKGWELVQILTPPTGAKHIHVLFRQRKSN
ncbi:MAG: hypothetical protein IPM56_14355 [Ignavibacteriales bacterium]|nr:MAG: hypothetical protein IPM56_14355 [Ignavibacteriales bacterium]